MLCIRCRGSNLSILGRDQQPLCSRPQIRTAIFPYFYERHTRRREKNFGKHIVLALSSDVTANTDISALASVLGYAAATGFFALWFVEQKLKQGLESELQLAKSKADDYAAKADKLTQELEVEKKNSDDLKMYKRRLDESTKDILKLERALEQKDGQLESFTVVAQRQIKYLEDMVKDLKKSA